MNNLNAILIKLLQYCPEIDAAVISTEKGELITFEPGDFKSPSNVGSFVSSVMEKGINGLKDIGYGELVEAVLRGDNGYIIIYRIKNNLFLTILATKEGDFKRMFRIIRLAASGIEKISHINY
ncbi:MAG: roadblock/LC7 domain-containing protein [Deltaproteobacteria bacterium]|nr:roadblock/LC7 domain-containing protein [Deltaproteobacteria bacterium]